ncbi:ankyrin repeat domain protein [Francisella sp. W12-1067]|nr:ankyrin repeat domain protein [Francisella sp. W12-1067]
MSYYDNLIKNIKDISEYCGWGDYYTALGLPKGLCFGMAAMWGQAYLSDDVDTFHKRLQLLTRDSISISFNNNNYNKLTDLINAVCNYEKRSFKCNTRQVDRYSNLEMREKKIYDNVISIRAFLDGLLAYHTPCNTFLNSLEGNKIIYQNVVKTSPFVINEKLTAVSQKIFDNQRPNITYQKVSPFIEVYNYPFIGKKENYCSFLKPLFIRQLNKSNFNFCVSVNSLDHAITFNSNLELYDANMLSLDNFKASKYFDIENLVINIFKSFDFNIERDGLLALNILVYISPKHRDYIPDLKKSLGKIKIEIDNRLHRYINSFFKWKNHKKRATYTRNKVREIDVGKLHTFIKEENYLLQGEGNLSNLKEAHYKNNRQSSDNSLNRSRYKQIIVESLKNISDTYANTIVGDKDYYKVELQKVISKGYHQNTNLLYIACERGHKEIVELLLANDVNINKATDTGATPLYITCARGYKKIVGLLLAKHDININQTIDTGATPLYVACEKGHKEIVELLLENSAAINLPQNTGATPLYVACEKGHKEIAELLLENSAAINLPQNAGATPLYVACQEGHKDIVGLLLAKHDININQTIDTGATPLYVACQEGRTEIVELLLSEILLATNSNAIASYFVAGCSKGSNNQVLALLKRHFCGHNINAPWDMPLGGGTKKQITPLLYGCRFMYNRSIKWLLDNYSCLKNTISVNGSCALEWYRVYKDTIGYDQHIEQKLESLSYKRIKRSRSVTLAKNNSL